MYFGSEEIIWGGSVENYSNRVAQKKGVGIRCLRALGMVAGCISGMMCGVASLLF
jgi:hypothetical protein